MRNRALMGCILHRAVRENRWEGVVWEGVTNGEGSHK